MSNNQLTDFHISFEQCADALLVIQSNLTTSAGSVPAYNVLGAEASQITGKSFAEMVDAADREPFLRAIAQILREGHATFRAHLGFVTSSGVGRGEVLQSKERAKV
jgi:hypothetical protein